MTRTRAFACLFSIVISLLVAAVFFQAGRHGAANLVIVMRSSVEGTGQVFLDTGSGFAGTAAENLALTDSGGDWIRYTVPLPRTGLKAIKVVPLAGSGEGVDVSQVSLLSRTAQYTWKRSGETFLLEAGRSTAATDPDVTPQLATTNESSLTITAVPDPGTADSPSGSLGLALLAALISLVCVFRLTGPAVPTGPGGSRNVLAARGAWLLLLATYLYQLHVVHSFAVDVPYMDEWDTYFTEDGLLSGFSWQWLFGFHNQHRIVLTKFMTWLNLKFFGLDLLKQQLFNYLLYGALLVALARLKEKITPSSFTLFPLFLIFLLSPINWENNSWGFQSQLHMALIFSVLALMHAYESGSPSRNIVCLILFALLSAYSFLAGVTFAFVYLVCYLIFIVSEIINGRIEAKKGITQILILSVVIGAGIAYWFVGYVRPDYDPPLALPYSGIFWSYFLNVVSLAFGFARTAHLPGIICLVLVVTPLILLLVVKEHRSKPAARTIVTAILGVLAVLAVISMGRAGISDPKSSRYSEIGMLLIPYTAISLWLVIPREKWRNLALTAFWCFCFAASFSGWSDNGYREQMVGRLFSLSCIDQYYKGSGDGRCLETFPRPLGEYLESARKLRVKFTRQFKEQG